MGGCQDPNLKAQRPEKGRQHSEIQKRGGHHYPTLKTCKELKAQRFERGGHHYASWETNVKS